jgi:hypothetical protein
MIKFVSEKSLENFIVSHFNDTGMCILTDEQYESVFQQYNIGVHGIPDLVFISKEHPQEGGEKDSFEILVVELKNEAISFSAIAQISKYKAYFDRVFGETDNVRVRYLLVTQEQVDPCGEIDWMVANLGDIEMVEFKLNPYSGVEFNHSEKWNLVGFDDRYGMELIKESK